MKNIYLLILNYLYFLFLYSKYLSSQTIQNRMVFSEYEVVSLLWSFYQIYGNLEYSMLYSRITVHRSSIMDNSDTNLFIQSQTHGNYHSDNQQVYQIRYVEYQFGVGGLANKIFGLVSSYVIAALLNATFIRIIESIFTM